MTHQKTRRKKNVSLFSQCSAFFKPGLTLVFQCFNTRLLICHMTIDHILYFKNIFFEILHSIMHHESKFKNKSPHLNKNCTKKERKFAKYVCLYCFNQFHPPLEYHEVVFIEFSKLFCFYSTLSVGMEIRRTIFSGAAQAALFSGTHGSVIRNGFRYM